MKYSETWHKPELLEKLWEETHRDYKHTRSNGHRYILTLDRKSGVTVLIALRDALNPRFSSSKGVTS